VDPKPVFFAKKNAMARSYILHSTLHLLHNTSISTTYTFNELQKKKQKKKQRRGEKKNNTKQDETQQMTNACFLKNMLFKRHILFNNILH